MTFTLLARCPSSGRLGLAIGSASLAVAARCPYAAGRIGVVTTQNRTDPTLGTAVLAQLAAGMSAQAALDAVIARARFPEWRQLAVIDAEGRLATHNGERCSGRHAQALGDQCVALGNLLADEGVPAAMIAGFVAAAGSLEERLLAGLAAGLAAGGEINPLRSAGLVVAGGDPFPYTDLRVDQDPRPVERLAALLQAWTPEADKCRRWALDPYGA